MNSFNSLLEKIEHAKELDFGDILNKTFELFKKAWLQGFFLVLILLIFLIPFIIALYLPMYNAVLEQVQNGDYDPNDASSLLKGQSSKYQYMVMGFTFFVSFFSTILVAGFYNIIKRIDFGESFKFTDLFMLFKLKYFGKVFAIASFSLLVSLVGVVLEWFLPQAAASIISVVLSLVFSVYSALFVVFFAFNPDLEASDIFVLSFNLGTKKWLLIFGLLIVASLIGFLGAIACGFGMLFTISIAYIPVYFVYKEIIGFNVISDIEQIGINDDSDY